MIAALLLCIFVAAAPGADATAACAEGAYTRSGCCVFPFTYQGKKYTECTTTNDVKPWCALTSNYEQGKYGYCSKACGAKHCVYPFIYQGKSYDSCLDGWCATTDDYDRDRCWKPCPIDGGWSDWKASGSCSTTCGAGQQTQKRTCDNPSPAYEGKTCAGESSKTQACTLAKCPVPTTTTTTTTTTTKKATTTTTTKKPTTKATTTKKPTTKATTTKKPTTKATTTKKPARRYCKANEFFRQTAYFMTNNVAFKKRRKGYNPKEITNPYYCMTWCREVAACFAWTYFRNAGCYLKNQNFFKHKVRQVRAMSAPKYCS